MAITVGPWDAIGRVKKITIVSNSANPHDYIADCYDSEGVDGEANARLIALAPEMLAYIKERAQAGDEEARKLVERLGP